MRFARGFGFCDKMGEPAAGVSGAFSSGFFAASVLRLDEQCVALGMAAGERIAELDDYYASHPKQAADTFHAEFTANAGLAAPQSGVRNSFYAESDLLYSLANLFRDAGYRAPMIVDLFSLNADPAVLAMCEQVHEQLDILWDTFRYNYFAHWAKGKN